ncbi:MAG: carbon monoxide dehydrogenase subunit G [Anaerolineales bacterium]
MHAEGSVTIDAPRGQVWAFLTDPNQVGKCAPGLESMEIIEEDKRFRAVVSVGFGSMKARFSADVEWVELAQPDRAKMKAHGTAPGSTVDATSEMNLTENEAGGTDLDWTADITIQGTIASLASRLMGSMTQRLTGEFFDCVKKNIEG